MGIKNDSGFSLLELNCTIAMASIILFCVFHYYAYTHKVYAQVNAMAEIKENGHFAAYLFESTIAQAGLIGCSSMKTVFFPYLSIYDGEHRHWSNGLLNMKPIHSKPNTDAIAVQYVDSQAVSIFNIHSNKIEISSSHSFNLHDTVVVFNCLHAVMRHIQEIYIHGSGATLLLDQPLDDQKFLSGSKIGILKKQLFFIDKTSRRRQGGETIYALYQQDETKKNIELIQNIVDLKIQPWVMNAQHILYGRSIADVGTDVSSIVSLKIDILGCSSQKVYQEKNQYLCRTFSYVIPLNEQGINY
jgi:hypothetical protein